MAAVITTMEFIVERLILLLTIKYPNIAENMRTVEAKREAVDAGRYAYAYAYMRLSAALKKPKPMYDNASFNVNGVGDALVKKYIGSKMKSGIGHPATDTHEMIHLLLPPFEKYSRERRLEAGKAISIPALLKSKSIQYETGLFLYASTTMFL
ncbi:hypothetical protein HanRHA438_Chr03g0104611 [Helianthus annuus]|nr:hypothetical protein HanRHA438_Chr03g0104611 [Helianthus annuus]